MLTDALASHAKIEASAHDRAMSALAGDEKAKPKVKRRQPDTFCKGQKIRIFPSKKQQDLLRGWVGSGRYLWNWALEKQNQHFEAQQKHLSTGSLSREITELRQTPDLDWLGLVPRTALSQTFRKLDKSWAGFFDGIKGKRLDSPGKPQFRAKCGSRESATFQVDPRHEKPYRFMKSQDMGHGELRIPGLGWVRAFFSEPVMGEVSSITVKQEGNTWVASFSLINIEQSQLHRNTGKKADKKIEFNFPQEDPTCLINNPHREGLAAIDGSVPKGGVATSNGTSTFSLFTEAQKARAAQRDSRRHKYEKSKAFKHDCAMKAAGYTRNEDGTWPKRDYKKTPRSKRELAVTKKMSDISLHQLFSRVDAIHKFTTDLVLRHHTIVVETLILNAMAQSLSRGFRRRMHEACMGEIIRQLKYKCEWHNRTLLFVDQWFASSKRCSNTLCHQKNTELTLNDREWTCVHCGTHHERDDNAAFNLWQEGWRLLEEVFQKNNTICLAAGSAVRGSQGLIVEVKKTRPKRVSKPKPVSPE